MKFLLKTMQRKNTLSLLGICLLLSPIKASAQGYIDGNEKRYGDVPLVSIFEDCDFRGERRDITVGEFNSMRTLDFGNDKLSSIRVPRGLEVVIFKDDNLKGDYARVNKNVRCFDDYWNDEVSSLTVEYADGAASHKPSKPYKPKPRSHDDRRDQYNDGVNGRNVSKVAFKGRVLQQVGSTTWELQDFRRGVSQYTEVRRDSQSVTLENQYTSAQLRIDLFANDVTMIGPRGKVTRFPIKSREASLASKPRKPNKPDVVKRGPNRRIKGECFAYRAYTNGGQGGIRFHGKEGFHRFTKKGHKGRICHNGTLTMEMNKTDPNTQVVVEIQGKGFVFGRGEKEDAYRNTWYRKLVKLKVSR